MWIMTPFGILMPNTRPPELVKADPLHRELQVRARERAYLDAFRERYCPTLGESEHHPDQDYPWKAPVGREELAVAVGKAVLDVDYGKFKPSTEGPHGLADKTLAARLHACYNALWSTQLNYGDGTSVYDKPVSGHLSTPDPKAPADICRREGHIFPPDHGMHRPRSCPDCGTRKHPDGTLRYPRAR